MKRIGIFSGSFNPIHIGHLALANWLCEYEEVDEIWFLVTPHNPLKSTANLLDEGLRYAMVEAAIGDYPKCKASNFESALPQPSYSIHTFRALQKSMPDSTFILLIGADNWHRIDQWKEHDALLSEFDVLVYPRKGYTINIPPQYNRVRAVDAPLIEISSTFIRQALKEGRDIRFFLPESIRRFIPAIKTVG